MPTGILHHSGNEQHDPMRLTRTAPLRRELRPYARAVLGFSLVVNLLLLVAPVYMLQIYDRVLTSGSYDALFWLTVIALFLLALYGVAEAGRRRVITLAGQRLDQRLAPAVFDAFESNAQGERLLERNIMRINRLRGLFQAGVFLPLFDLPFAPLFLALLFLVHPWLGVFGLVAAALVLTIAIIAERSTRDAGKQGTGMEGRATELAFGLARQRSAIVAMGLKSAAFEKWATLRDAAAHSSMQAARGDTSFTALSRSTRQGLQILILGISAALALSQSISMGSIIAGSIILSRALAPLDQIVGSWRTLMQGREAWQSLRTDVDSAELRTPPTRHPRPDPVLQLERLAIRAPGAENDIIHPFTFRVDGGGIVTIMGVNGAGKSSLLQTLAGAWPAGGGRVMLGGRDLHAWPASDRGRHVGYVPQDVEILPGTVKENIARFQSVDDETVFETARRAMVHEAIMGLPEGYDTPVGPGGLTLSAGQRQLIGLARALFGDPVLLLLDEPTANLDSARAQGFISAMRACASDGMIVLASSHDIRWVQASDTVLLIRDGAVTAAEAQRYLEAAMDAHQKDMARRSEPR